MCKNTLKLTFAGQAGFILQTADGCTVGIDLYLSDCCNRYFGLKRLMPYVFDPADLKLDLLIATHAHYDHFDPDSIPLLLAKAKGLSTCEGNTPEQAQVLEAITNLLKRSFQ